MSRRLPLVRSRPLVRRRRSVDPDPRPISTAREVFVALGQWFVSLGDRLGDEVVRSLPGLLLIFGGIVLLGLLLAPFF